MKIRMPTGVVRGLKGRIDALIHDWHSSDDEIFYSIVAEEIEQDNIHKGLWLKALAKSDGDEDKAQGVYVTLRTASIRKLLIELAKARGLATEVLSEIASKAKELEELGSQEHDLGDRLSKLQRERESAIKRLDEKSAIYEKVHPEYVASERLANRRFLLYALIFTLSIVFGVPVIAHYLNLQGSDVVAEGNAFGYWVYNFQNIYFIYCVLFGWLVATFLAIALARTSVSRAIAEKHAKISSEMNIARTEIDVLDEKISSVEAQSEDVTLQIRRLSGDIDKLQSTFDDALRM